MVSDSGSTVAIAGLSVPLAKTAKVGLINIASITAGADSVGGELTVIAIDAGHSLVASTIAVSGLGLPLAKALGRPVLIRGATIGMVSNSRSTITITRLSLPLAKTLGRPVGVGEAIRVGSRAGILSKTLRK